MHGDLVLAMFPSLVMGVWHVVFGWNEQDTMDQPPMPGYVSHLPQMDHHNCNMYEVLGVYTCGPGVYTNMKFEKHLLSPPFSSSPHVFGQDRPSVLSGTILSVMATAYPCMELRLLLSRPRLHRHQFTVITGLVSASVSSIPWEVHSVFSAFTGFGSSSSLCVCARYYCIISPAFDTTPGLAPAKVTHHE